MLVFHRYFFAFVFVLLGWSCTEETQNSKASFKSDPLLIKSDSTIHCNELAELIHANSEVFSDVQTVDGFTYKLSFKPWQLMACLEYPALNSDTLYNRIKSEFSDLIYFNIAVSVLDHTAQPSRYKVANETELNKKIDLLSYDLLSRFRMIVQADTVECVLYHFEQGTASSATDQFVLAFPYPKTISRQFYVFFDDVAFSNKKIMFSLPGDQIRLINKLRVLK